VFPFVAVAVIVTLDLVTHDASAGAQVFFFFPVLYAASQLRRQGAAALCLAVVTGDLAVIFTELSPRTAVVESSYLICALVATAVLLLLAGERQAELIEQLRRQAAIDPLTGLVTRRVLDTAAHSALTGAATGTGTALILIDVDNFKTVNDRHGHPAGDEVLVQLGTLLVASSGPNDTVSRMGGDEVAVLMAGCSLTAAVCRADQILWDVRAHDFVLDDGTRLSVSVSIGLAHAPTHADDLRSLYAAADTSLYAAKRGGRNQVGSYAESR
jgi:diguanylate cyclase (GGDEF)-like protein